MMPANRQPAAPGPTARGFTLIELLLAVTLLVLIVLVSSYIFDTTMRAVSQTQANNELNVSLETFAQLLRKDIRGIEHDNFLVLGARRHAAFATAKDRANGRKQTFRHDWMMFLLNSEHDASGDNLVLGQAARVLYGHGKVADPNGYGFKDQTSSMPLTAGLYDVYSNLATDWVVMRHQMSILPKVYESPSNPGSLYSLGYENIEVAGQASQYGTGAMHQRSLLSPYVRDFRWCAWTNSQWLGSVYVSYGPDGGTGTGRLAIYEPIYYHYMPVRHRDPRRFHALPHAAHLAVQYAMPEDLGAGPGGSTLWRDPPEVGRHGYADPNFKSSDPLHPFAAVPASGMHAGRLAFGPGDRWPALLRVEAHIHDPLDRLDGGKKIVLVVPVP